MLRVAARSRRVVRIGLAGAAVMIGVVGFGRAATAKARAGQVCAKAGALATDAGGRTLKCVARGKQKRWETRPAVASGPTLTTVGSPTAAATTKGPAATTPPPNPSPPTTATTTGATVAQAAPSGKRCLLFLHGKGGKGYGARERDGFTDIGPDGNAAAPKEWGGNFQWLYADEADYKAALSIMVKAVDGQSCGQIVLAGASNGGAMAAKVYCRGESFGTRLVGALFDDPVPDQVIDGCKPAPRLQLALIQSDWMDAVVQGGKPCPSSWTCQGNVYGLADYAKGLGVAKPGRTKEHSSAGDLTPYIAPWWR